MQSQVPEKAETPKAQPKKSRVDDILAGMATGNKDLQKGMPIASTQDDLSQVKEGNDLSSAEKGIKQTDSIPEVNQSGFKDFKKDKAEHEANKKKPVPAPDRNEPPPLPTAAETTKTEINDYGIPEPVKKEEPKYTDSDVARMIRERLERVKQSATPAQVKEIAQEFKNDPNATVEQWEREFDDHVNQAIEKREAKSRHLKMQEEENKIQTDFETKFSQGMSKYDDFWVVVNKTPITPHMMIATRSIENPAAFLYAAAKMHPEALSKIASMSDPTAQMVEIGRLEERMLKASRNTKAPRPLERHQSDDFEIREEKKAEPSIEERIAQHAKSKKGF